MPAVRLTDASGVTYFDLPTGDHLKARKESIKDFDKLPEKVQRAWLDTWSEEAQSDAVSGVEGIAAMTEYLKASKRRTDATMAARKAVIVEALSVPLKEAREEVHTVGDSKTKFDLIAAVREVLGVGYSTLQSWAGEVSPTEIRDEIDRRAQKAAMDAADKRAKKGAPKTT